MIARNTIYCDLQLETSTSEFCPIIEVVTPGCKRSNNHISAFRSFSINCQTFVSIQFQTPYPCFLMFESLIKAFLPIMVLGRLVSRLTALLRILKLFGRFVMLRESCHQNTVWSANSNELYMGLELLHLEQRFVILPVKCSHRVTISPVFWL